MAILEDLAERLARDDAPFLVGGSEELRLRDVFEADAPDLSGIEPGDVVALIGDLDRSSILALLHLIERAVIVVPLTKETRTLHEDFFDVAQVDVVLEAGELRRRRAVQGDHEMLAEVRRRGHPGLILFSSGTTGRPKAVLHDFDHFLRRYRTPRPAFRTLSFLLFDHIGGINTLFHTLYNGGCVVVPSGRTPAAVFGDIRSSSVELLPTTPTFLRMMLMGGVLEGGLPDSLKVVTYGTERMDQGTLDELCRLLPKVEFRQTYGMSELGILRIKSRSRDSLWMTIGGEGVETKVVDSVLKIRASNRMIGYLNGDAAFDDEGWYDTKDIVERDGDWIKITGRTSETISVGGVKFLPGEVERAALAHPAVALAVAKGVPNPITGQHVVLLCELKIGADTSRESLRDFLKERLPESMRPHRIRLGTVPVGHRYKRQ